MTISQIIFFVFMALCAVCLFYYLFKATRYMQRHNDDFVWPGMPREREDDEDGPMTEKKQ